MNFINKKEMPFGVRLLVAIVLIPIIILTMMATVMAVGLYYDIRFKDTVYFITSKLSVFPIIFSYSALMYFVLKIFRKNDRFMQRIAFIGIIIGFSLGAVSLIYFNKFTLDGVYTYSAFRNTYYSFEDLSNFNVAGGSDGVLEIEFEMLDNKEISLMGGALEATVYSGSNNEKYYAQDETKEYILDIAKIMKENNVPLNVDTKKLNEDIEYEYWLDIANDIIEIYNEN